MAPKRKVSKKRVMHQAIPSSFKYHCKLARLGVLCLGLAKADEILNLDKDLGEDYVINLVVQKCEEHGFDSYALTHL